MFSMDIAMSRQKIRLTTRQGGIMTKVDSTTMVQIMNIIIINNSNKPDQQRRVSPDLLPIFLLLYVNGLPSSHLQLCKS